jgi:hypothetical protein
VGAPRGSVAVRLLSRQSHSGIARVRRRLIPARGGRTGPSGMSHHLLKSRVGRQRRSQPRRWHGPRRSWSCRTTDTRVLVIGLKPPAGE